MQTEIKRKQANRTVYPQAGRQGRWTNIEAMREDIITYR
jgi:hypothetical protein